MSLNVPLLRAAQRSIADLTHKFDMSDWDCCIAGHIMAISGIQYPYPDNPRVLARDLAGLDELESEGLFYWFSGADSCNRQVAINKIETVIRHSQPAAESTPEPELVCV